MGFEMQINELKSWVEASDNIVFFGGAGVSTESGIPDFRSADGLYNQVYDYPPETIISHTFYKRKPDVFFKFYKDKMLYPNAEPGISHLKLAELEKAGKLKGVITQNIDGLHQKAGSGHVIELHGSVLRNYCEKCGRFYGMDYVFHMEGVPYCECGGTVKPDVVLYEESLEESAIEEALRLIQDAEILIVGGTSLGVYPAAGLINDYRGGKLVLINKSNTPYDKKADLLINDALANVFSKLDSGIKSP